jgi:helix-turn-helix protein
MMSPGLGGARGLTINPHMFIMFDRDRASDSPLIERVWSCHSESGGTFSSVASPHCEIVFSRLNGITTVTLRGPETRARPVDCPPQGEWFAIRFRPGTYFPSLPAWRLIDGNDANLPAASSRSFWLHGTRWQHANFENAETFVARLEKAGVIARDATVAAALEGDSQILSLRSIQRRFRAVCGITHTALRQIERARHAAVLLTHGAPISEAQHEAGFYDQAHLTRSMRRYVGATPATIVREDQQLSFLYKK